MVAIRDRFSKVVSDVDAPAQYAFEIADMHVFGGISTVEVGVLETPTRAIYIGRTGNLYCRMVNTYNDSAQTTDLGSNVFFKMCPQEQSFPSACRLFGPTTTQTTRATRLH